MILTTAFYPSKSASIALALSKEAPSVSTSSAGAVFFSDRKRQTKMTSAIRKSCHILRRKIGRLFRQLRQRIGTNALPRQIRDEEAALDQCCASERTLLRTRGSFDAHQKLLRCAPKRQTVRIKTSNGAHQNVKRCASKPLS